MKSIGIDLGGTSAKIGVVEEGTLLASLSFPTRRDSDYPMILKEIAESVGRLCEDYPVQKIGIGSPGLVNTVSGTVCFSNNIRWSDAPLRDDLARLTGLPVAIANDARCAVLGEAVYGAGRGYTRVAMLTLGTGVGGGFVVDGTKETPSVHADAAGIFGHMTLVPQGRRCNCGRRGCLEVYCSATALAREANSFLGKNADAKALFDAAREGHPQALACVDTFAQRLGSAVASLGNILRPDCFVIGGGVAASAPAFLPRVNDIVREEVFGFAYAPFPVVAAARGNEAGILGASLL